MTFLYFCVLFFFQIFHAYQSVFMNILLMSRLTLYKCIVSAFIQRSWLIRNWTIPLLRVDAVARLSIYLETSSLGSIARLQ